LRGKPLALKEWQLLKCIKIKKMALEDTIKIGVVFLIGMIIFYTIIILANRSYKSKKKKR